MVHKRHNPGFTLIEILVVVAVIVVLAGVLWKMGYGLEVKGQVQQQNEAFAILDSALQEYYEVTGQFPEALVITDVNDFVLAQARTEFMWQRLLALPESRFVAERLSGALLNSLYVATNMEFWPKPHIYKDGLEIYDVWGKPVEYLWHANMAFPLLRSYGPNGVLEDPNIPSDDITNR
jgi:prepilin-type N-terminal cleavage/methylation domain-containing protein